MYTGAFHPLKTNNSVLRNTHCQPILCFQTDSMSFGYIEPQDNDILKIGIVMWPGFHGNQETDLGKIYGFWMILPQQMRYHGNRMSDFQNKSFFVERILRKSMLAIICLNFTVSTIFLVNNGHRAIKMHVKKFQYCRAGHIWSSFFPSVKYLPHPILQTPLTPSHTTIPFTLFLLSPCT